MCDCLVATPLIYTYYDYDRMKAQAPSKCWSHIGWNECKQMLTQQTHWEKSLPQSLQGLQEQNPKKPQKENK
jgi:hypothetical protein